MSQLVKVVLLLVGDEEARATVGDELGKWHGYGA